MDSLTKENFWNGLKEAYPKEMESFCTWIDLYKKRVGWKCLFSGMPFMPEEEQDRLVAEVCNKYQWTVPEPWCYCGDLLQDQDGTQVIVGYDPKDIAELRRRKRSWKVIPSLTPKYHDLPIAMQIGIFIQFVIEAGSIHSEMKNTLAGSESMDYFVEQIKLYFKEAEEIVTPNQETVLRSAKKDPLI